MALPEAAVVESEQSTVLERAGRAYADGRFADCRALLAQHLEAQADDHDARTLLAEPELLAGDYAAGLQHYESRWLTERFQPYRRPFAQPLWQGEPLGRQTLLITPEQALGEAVMFSRFAPLLLHLHPMAHIVLEVQQRAAALLGHSFQNARRLRVIATLDRAGSNLPPFDLQVPLCSLPHRLQMKAENIPAAEAYLYAPEARRVAPDGSLAIGLSWRSINPQSGKSRSLPLPELARMLQQPGVRLVNLQYGESQRDQEELLRKEGITLANPEGVALDGDLTEVADLAAGCDLVVCIDNTLAHLGAALGRPTWVLLPHAPSWRWHLEREDSPWYPTARLFRQPTRGDWQAPLVELRSALLDLLTERGKAAP
jgi:ADP-heptose:LPS heptosyltransferase